MNSNLRSLKENYQKNKEHFDKVKKSKKQEWDSKRRYR